MTNKLFFCLIFFVSIPQAVLAISTDFTMRVLVGGDTTPPTTPTLLSAIPVATSQIDLSWSASTDNFTIDGYVLLRDGAAIATTTLTSFNDTGLTAETLYSYEVYAFDNSFNISTTSNSLSTTTLSIPVTTPVASTSTTPNNSSESTRTPSLRDLSIVTTNHEARFVWETSGPTRYTLRWGKNNEYNGGYISNDVYRTGHETVITDLESNREYFYELIGYTPSNIPKVIKTGQFITETDTNNFSPPNVLRLSALADRDDVTLSWQLPSSVSIKSIRVLSSPYGYPVDINDGEVVYDGLGTEALDKNALSETGLKYYSVFVIDEKGGISSGAVVFVNKNILSDGGEILPNNTKPTSTSTLTEEISLHNFDPANIKIFQNDVVFDFDSERINLIYQKSFTISIPYEAVPRHLKSIIVTLLDPTDNRRSYSFLLRINKEGTAYESTIAPLNVIGSSRLQIEIFDFESQLIGLYRKQIDFTVTNSGVNNVNKEVIFPDKVIESARDSAPFLVVFAGLLLHVVLFAWWRRRVEDK